MVVFEKSPFRYQAAEGWDPASGLGSLNFTAMLDHALTLYPNRITPSSPLPAWAPLIGSQTADARACPVNPPPLVFLTWA